MRSRRRLVVLSGLPGTGKSTLAELLSRTLGHPVFSVDPIESAMVSSGVARSFETGLAAYRVSLTLAEMQLARGQGAIIDAVNAVEPAKDMWRGLARRFRIPLIAIECVLSVERLHRRRIAGRLRGLELPEPEWGDVERRRVEFTVWREGVLVVDGGEPKATRLRRALAWVRRHERRGAPTAAARAPRAPRPSPAGRRIRGPARASVTRSR